MIDEPCIPINFKSLLKLKLATTARSSMLTCVDPVNIEDIYELYAEALPNCYKLCKTTSYIGKVQTTTPAEHTSNQRTVEIYYWFGSNNIQFHEEYLIYDTTTFLGYIGGALSLRTSERVWVDGSVENGFSLKYDTRLHFVFN